MSTPLKRYRYGETLPAQAPFIISPAYQYNEGDFLYLTSTPVTTPDGNTGYGVAPAQEFTYSTAIADPASAPTGTEVATSTSNFSGPGFTSGTGYLLYYTWLTNTGLESGPSPASSAITLDTSHCIVVTCPSLPAGVSGINWYVTNASGTSPQLAATTVGAAAQQIVGPPQANAPTYPAANGLSALVLSQNAFVQSFYGICNQTNLATGNLTTEAYGIKDGYITSNGLGEYDFACAAANWNNGDLIAIGTLNSLNLDPQTVIKTTIRACAIARCVRTATSSTVVRGNLFGTKQLVAQPY